MSVKGFGDTSYKEFVKDWEQMEEEVESLRIIGWKYLRKSGTDKMYRKNIQWICKSGK